MTRKSSLGNIRKVSIKNWANRDSGDYLSQAIQNLGQNRVLSGHRVFAPTTASTQVTGAGATTVRVNIDYGLVSLAGAPAELSNTATLADNVLVTASPLMSAGQSTVVAVVVYKAANGTATLLGVAGTPATTGTQTSPSDGTIQLAVNTASSTTGLEWVRLAETLVNRTADTTLTQSYDNTKKDVGLTL